MLAISAAARDPYPFTGVPMLICLVDYEAAWSPSGQEIVRSRNRHGGTKVHILIPASGNRGSDMRQITTGPTRTIRRFGRVTMPDECCSPIRVSTEDVGVTHLHEENVRYPRGGNKRDLSPVGRVRRGLPMLAKRLASSARSDFAQHPDRPFCMRSGFKASQKHLSSR